nr:dimethylsulfonioproprionate lyase family protein [Mesorhizobium tianshanense]
MRSQESVARISARLEVPGVEHDSPGRRVPVCDEYLDETPRIATAEVSLIGLAARSRDIELRLQWQTRTSYDDSTSSNFVRRPRERDDRRKGRLGSALR